MKREYWEVIELLGSGYTTHEVARILDIPFHIVLWIETEMVDKTVR